MLQSQAPRVSSWRASSSGLSRKVILRAVGALALLVGAVALVLLIMSRLGGGPSRVAATVGDPSTDSPAAQTYPPAAPGVTDPTLALNQPPTNPTPPVTPAAATPPGAPQTSPASNTTPPAAPASTGNVPGDLRDLLEAGNKAMAAGNLLDARTALNKALFDSRLPAADRKALRQQIATINDTLVFSSKVAQGDPLFDTYTVKSGDNPTLIMRSQCPFIDKSFLVRINQISNPSALRIGQRMKVPRQPFHVIVHKSDYRMDLYMGPPTSITSSPGRVGADGQEESWTYIRSFPVGLGDSNGTPEGLFVVRPASKLINPRWVNPHTGEVFEKDDPKNPLGERWIGLDGVDENTRRFTGYGIHGTIDPDSIGQQRSMGCVRMLADDVALVYEVLMDKVSSVLIIK